jgi:hypothetical protein
MKLEMLTLAAIAASMSGFWFFFTADHAPSASAFLQPIEQIAPALFGEPASRSTAKSPEAVHFTRDLNVILREPRALGDC